MLLKDAIICLYTGLSLSVVSVVFARIIFVLFVNSGNVSEKNTENAKSTVHEKTDWYHIAFGKVRSFDYGLSTTMFRVHRVIRDSKTEKYDRFYTVYCREISNSYDSAINMTSSKAKDEALHKISETYNIIFNTMLTDITKNIESENDISTDVEGVKNFAKLNGDYDTNMYVKKSNDKLKWGSFMEKNELICILNNFAREHPNEIIAVEYPVHEEYELKDGSKMYIGSRCADLKLGDACIYESFDGKIIIDTE